MKTNQTDIKTQHPQGLPDTSIKKKEPAYVQICNILKEQIGNGTYLPGSRLPSESELRRRYQVSPMTVRRSIKVLTDQGVVTTIQGGGTFVKAPDMGGATFGMKEFYSLFNDREKAKVKLLETKILKADGQIAAKLHISEGRRVIMLKRLVLKEGDPVLFHREYLIYDPGRPVIEKEMEVTALYGLFERTGRTFIKRGDLSLDAVVLSPEEARLLNTLALAPAFRLEHLFYDFDDIPMSWGQFICRADQLRFKTVVGINPDESIIKE